MAFFIRIFITACIALFTCYCATASSAPAGERADSRGTGRDGVSAPSAGEDTTDALRQYEAAAGNNPGQADALSRLTVLYGQRRRGIDAENIFTKLIASDPKNEAHRLSLAFFYQSGGMRDKAMAETDRVLAANPSSGKAHLLKGFIYEGSQDLPSAIHEYSAAIALAEASRDTGLAIEGRFRLGYLYDNAQLFFDAVTQFEKIISTRPDLKKAYLELAHILDRLGHTDRAIATLKPLIISDREVPQAYAMLGLAYFKKGYYETSLRYFALAEKSGVEFGNEVIAAVKQKIYESKVRDDNGEAIDY